ncbi:MAG TPA: hypothetical protein VJX67_09820, partial [Blastocatellia bacterium]|nr:hypothetical protein [Blastocatellia bacterium]
MVTTTRKRSGELLRAVFEALIQHPEGQVPQTLFRELEHTVRLTSSELIQDQYHGLRQFEEIILRGSIPMIKAGWLERAGECFRVTYRGREAFAEYEDPELFVRQAARRSIKGWLVIYAPRTYSIASRLIDQVIIEWDTLRKIGPGSIFRTLLGESKRWQKVLPLQSPQRYSIKGVKLASYEDLLRYLESGGIAHNNAGHTFYLSPDTVTKTAFAGVMRNYPDGAGLKILKSPGTIDDSYLFGGIRNRRISVWYNRLVYNRRCLVLVANLFHAMGVGARVYDLVEIDCAGTVWTAYIVEHVAGRIPTVDECNTGIGRIRDLETRGLVRLTLTEGYDDQDFQPPGCNNNAFIDGAGRFQYVDFQSFQLVDYWNYVAQMAMGAAESCRTADEESVGSPAAQTGAINTINKGARFGFQGFGFHERSSAYQKSLAATGASIESKVVLDLTGDTGAGIATFLKLGAKWCHAWRSAEACSSVERFLLALGCTRFSLSANEVATRNEVVLPSEMVTPNEVPDPLPGLPGFLRPMLDECIVL